MLLLSIMIATGCRTSPIYDVPQTPLPDVSLGTREAQIARAAQMSGWSVEKLEPGVIVAKKTSGKHVAYATVRYGVDSFSIQSRNSVNLKQSNGRIHRVYNEWVRQLEDSIRREAAAPGYDLPASPAD